MRRVVTAIIVSLVAAGCRDVRVPQPLPSAPLGLRVQASPTPDFDRVTAGLVQALVPHGWAAVPAARVGGLHEGFVASPRPRGYLRMNGRVEGVAAVWVDVARVGIPSDYYYLAATGPTLERLTHSHRCSAAANQIYVDHRPEFITGRSGSPGDYVARGHGTCATPGAVTRWAYFVAAPGYGPVRQVGIPNSGLYVVVAVVSDSRDAEGRLRSLLRWIEFGGASVNDLIAAARA